MADEINKESWNNFILAHGGSFLQSWEWGEFQDKFWRKVKRFAGEDWQAQFVANKLPGVNKFYWHCPRGPVAKFSIFNFQFSNFLEQIKKTAGKDVIFFRLGPAWQIEKGIEKFKKAGFRQLSYDIEPSQTLILDIIKTEQELLAQMHEKWRYNIRLAERKGVQVKIISVQDDDFEKYFEEFYRLVSEGTAERKGIKHHPKEYYRKQLEITSPPPSPSKGEGEIHPTPPFSKEGDSSLYKREVGRDFKNILFVAEYEGKVIAANILVIFGKTATYLHGATSSEHREVMASHLLQWEQIKYAKQLGCVEYDFWGIVNEHTLDKRGPSWEGFTRFKKGFGGKEVNYVGYWDYPLDKKWYFLYRLVQKFRR